MRSVPIGLCVGAVLLGYGLVGPSLAPPREAGELCLTLLDVGQGDALLLEWPDGDVWLVDAGGTPGSRYDIGEAVVVPELRRRGIESLELVVMTHGDADHVGGLFAVLEQLEVGGLLLPRRQHLGSAERTLLGLADARGIPVLVAGEGDALPGTGAAHAAVLHPSGTWDPAGLAGINDWSVVLRVGLAGVDYLLTGDVEAAAEQWMVAAGVPMRATVLKLAHHGSRTSSGSAVLDAVDPLLAIASAGAENRFGFPHAAVTGRLQERAVPLYWTGRHGALRVCTDGSSVRATQEETEATTAALWQADSVAVANWQAREKARPASGQAPSSAEDAPKAPAKRKRAPKRRAKKLRSVDTGAGTAAPVVRPPSPPPPPELLPDREWERKRRARSKLRPGWKAQ